MTFATNAFVADLVCIAICYTTKGAVDENGFWDNQHNMEVNGDLLVTLAVIPINTHTYPPTH